MSLIAEIKPFPISPDARAFLDRLSEARSAKIAQFIKMNSIDNQVDASLAHVIVDMEQSPVSTNRAMLLIIGCDVQRPSDDATDDEIDDAISRVVSGLAAWNVFIYGSNALDRRKLVEVLFDMVLCDEVKMIPPSTGVVEIIDLNDKGLEETHDRDRFFPRPSVLIDSKQEAR